ncbi:MAG: hypothetical protein IPJ19_12290 [Planctomycetes bacterium]|nr:hypothetical protein [Planctomycetota bacterium]
MKIHSRRSLTLLAPLFLAFVPAADEIRFDPKPGTELTKKFDVSLELSVDDFSVEMNGQPLPAEAMGGVQGTAITLELAMGVTEKLVGVKDGRATDLLRTFDSVHGRAEAGEGSSDKSVEEMEGKTVHFVWDEAKSEYTKTWHECTGKDELLNSLSADMDLRSLLPSKKVSKGDKWDVEGSKVFSILLPGMQPGNLDPEKAGMDGEQAKAVQIMIDELGPQLEEGLKHLKVTCEYDGSHDADGVEVADIKLHVDGDMKLDLGPVFERIAAEQSRGGGPEPTVEASVSWSIKGDGALLWDNATHTLKSYTLDTDLQLNMKADASMDQGGQEMNFKANMGISGKGSWKLESGKGAAKAAETPTEKK